MHSKPLLYNNLDPEAPRLISYYTRCRDLFMCRNSQLVFAQYFFFLGESEKCRKYFTFQTIFESFWYKCISLSESLIEKICYFKQNSKIFSDVIKPLTHTLSGFWIRYNDCLRNYILKMNQIVIRKESLIRNNKRSRQKF